MTKDYAQLVEQIATSLLETDDTDFDQYEPYSFERKNPFSSLKSEREAPASHFDKPKTQQVLDPDDVADTSNIWPKGQETKPVTRKRTMSDMFPPKRGQKRAATYSPLKDWGARNEWEAEPHTDVLDIPPFSEWGNG